MQNVRAKEMKRTPLILLIAFSGYSVSGELNTLELLKRDLGTRIDVKSKNEIHFCPDNTCDIYMIENYNANFESYIYLDIYHNSKNIFLTEKYAGKKAFKLLAKEEPIILNNAGKFCQSEPITPKCVINGIKEKLNINKCFGRYDEGYFCYSCKESN